jgi:glycosyltransferase involved in cell wall biosynthesis
MGCRGKEKVERRFNWENIALAHLGIYERLTRAGGRD